MSKYETEKRYRKNHPKEIAESQRKYISANREKVADRKRKYREKNLERIKQYQKKYNERYENKIRAQDLRLKRKFNISLEEADVILILQHHKCPICKKSLMETLRSVDHNHKSGKVRGILCRLCNVGLGSFMDNPQLLENAAKYLRGKIDEGVK